MDELTLLSIKQKILPIFKAKLKSGYSVLRVFYSSGLPQEDERPTIYLAVTAHELNPALVQSINREIYFMPFPVAVNVIDLTYADAEFKMAALKQFEVWV